MAPEPHDTVPLCIIQPHQGQILINHHIKQLNFTFFSSNVRKDTEEEKRRRLSPYEQLAMMK
jgi:hypothetical protein